MIDAADIQDIFINSPKFLMEGKPYVTVGTRPYNYTMLAVLAMIGTMIRNLLWPRILSGVPRQYVQVTGIANSAALKELETLVEERNLKVHAGKLIKMEHVIQVRKIRAY